MLGWGAGADTGRRVTLWLLGGLVVATLVSLSGLFDATQARVAEQGTYCLRSGPHASQKAMWSDNGGGNWYE